MPSIQPSESPKSSAFTAPRWFLVAFTIFVLTVLAGLYITERVLPKTYTAKTLLRVLPRNSIGPSGGTLVGSLDSVEFQTEYEAIQSPNVLQPVIDQLGLGKIYAEEFHRMKEELANEDTLALLHQKLAISFVRGTRLIQISTSSERPQEAADIANSVAAHYQALRNDEEKKRDEEGISALRGQIADQQKLVDDKKAAYEKKRTDEVTATTVATDDPDADRIKNARHDIEKAQSLLDTLKIRLKEAIVSNQMEELPVKIISTAEAPDYPASPNRNLNLVLSLIAGVFLGALIATLIKLVLWLTSRPRRQA